MPIVLVDRHLAEGRKMTLFERFAVKAEDFILTRLVPLDNPGPVLKWISRIPLFWYSIGLPPFGNFILLLTTTGRKSGKLRRTPLEYRREGGSGQIVIMAAWGGKTDWRRNLQANPRVQVQTGRKKFEATAEALSDVEVAGWMAEAMRANPASARIWSRWAGEPVTISEPDSMLRAAKFFPSYRLKPLAETKKA